MDPNSKFSPTPIRSRAGCGFTLIEVTLAIAVVAIGLVAILALFPLGLRASRGALDDTQMASIAEEYIAKYQQAALDTNNYDTATNPTFLLAPTNYTNSVSVEYNIASSNYVVAYSNHVQVLDYAEFPVMTNAPTGDTNLISRVILQIWRPGSKTNYYVTEVARYVLP